MFLTAMETVFANAAAPQKIVLTVLTLAIPWTLISAGMALTQRSRSNLSSRMVADLRVAGPVLGLLAGLNSFHMGQTIQRLPFDPTLKQLAPGIFEVSTLISLGATVGVIAVIAHAAIAVSAARAGA